MSSPALPVTVPAARPRVTAWRGLPVAALFVVLLAATTILRPGFATPASLSGFLATYGPIACLAVGVSFAMLVGGIDLSVGPVLGLTNIVCVLLASVGTRLFSLGPSGAASSCSGAGTCQQGWPFLLAAVGAVLAGALFGLINGLAVGLLRLQPLLATLATGFVATGAGLWLFPQPGGQVPEGPLSVYGSSLAVPALVLLAVVLVALVVMRAPIGVRMRAVGSDPVRAFSACVPVRRTVVAAYTLSGALAGVGGVLFTLNFASGDPTLGVTFTLNAVAGAVLGGTALRGGWAEPFGPALGALVLGLLGSLVDALNVPTYYQQLVTGVVIVVALAASRRTSLRQGAAK